MQVTRGSISSEVADALVLQGEERLLVWIRSKGYDVGRAEDAYNTAILDAIKSKTKLTDWTYEPPMLTDLTLTIADLPDDGVTYLARWYDSQDAICLSEELATVERNSITLSVPDITADIALKLVRQ